MNPLRPLLAVLDAARDTITAASVRFAFGHDEDPDDRGLVVRVAGWHLQVDTDGLMFVRHGGIPLEDPEPVDLDEPVQGAWVVSPDTVRAWLDEVSDGRSVCDLMTEIELAEVGDE